jgi:transmembrane sensor
MIANETYWTELIARHLAGEATPDESARVEEWTEESDVHLRYYRECEAIWTNTGPAPYVGPASMDERWEQLEQQLQGADTAPPTAPIRRLVTRVAAAAAVMLLLFIGYRALQERDTAQPVVAVAEETSPATELSLPDGSKVWLRKGSEVTYAGGFEERMVVLQGEGYFEVEHDPERPFVVRVSSTTTRVLGTKFYLKETGSGNVELRVVEGKVAFANDQDLSQEKILVREQTAVAHLATGTIARVALSDEENALSWHTGRLTFNHEALAVVVEDLESHFGVGISISSPGMARCELKTDFQNATLEEVLETICFSLNCSYTMRGDVYYIKGEPCHTEEQ